MKDIKGYEGMYAVTSCGKVWSYRNKRFLTPCNNKGGYYIVTLTKDKKGKSYYVHRLVIETYLDNPKSLPEANHKDENKAHNYLNNLEWCDSAYNITYGTRIERQSKSQREAMREGRYKPFGKESTPVYCVELDKTYESISQAMKETNIRTIVWCCKGRQKTAGGYHWRYAS